MPTATTQRQQQQPPQPTPEQRALRDERLFAAIETIAPAFMGEHWVDMLYNIQPILTDYIVD